MRKRTLGFLLVPALVVSIFAACDDEEGSNPSVDAGVDARQEAAANDVTQPIIEAGPDQANPYVPNPVVIMSGFRRVPFEFPEMVAALPNDAGYGTPIASLSGAGKIAVGLPDGGYGIYSTVPATVWSNPARAVGIGTDPAGGAYLAVGISTPNGQNPPLDGGGTLQLPPRGLYHSLEDGGMFKADQGPPAGEFFGWLTAIENVGDDAYIADANGIIFKMNRTTGVVTTWLKDAALFSGNANACPGKATGAPRGFGAYALAFDSGNLYVANHDYGAIIKVPVNGDGSAGTPAIVVQGLLNGGTTCSYQGIKGLVRDTGGDGSWYFTAQFTHKIYKANADFTTITVFIEGRPPFDQPSGLFIDKNPATGKRRLLVANQAVIAHTADAGPMASVMEIELP